MDRTSKWNGILSLEEFNASSLALAKRWKEIAPHLPQWTWVPCHRTVNMLRVEGYLALEKMHHPSETSEEEVGGNSISGAEELDDVATLVESSDDSSAIYDYHITYSFSYRVPVLHFRARQSDGLLLNLNDIERNLPPDSLRILRESKWTFMTQEEHPYLNRPWHTLHPCGTSEWMKLLFGGKTMDGDLHIAHYLPAWLSVVGQAVGLRIPLELHSL